MSLFSPASPVRTSRMLAVLRIVAGVIFIMAGAMKAFGFPPPPSVIPPMPVIPPMWELHLAAWLEMIGGMPAAIFCFLFLYISFAGGGAWSIDALIARSKGGIAY